MHCSQTHSQDLSCAIKEKDNNKKRRTLKLQRTANKYAAKCRFCRKLMLIFSSFVTKQPSSNLRLWGAKRAFSSYQCGLGSNPPVDAICGLSLLLRFSRGSPHTPTPPPPTNISKSNLIQKGSRCTSTPSHSEKNHRDEEGGGYARLQNGRQRTMLHVFYHKIIIFLLI